MKEAKQTADDMLKSGAKVLMVSETGKPMAHELYIWNASDAWKRQDKKLWLGMALSSGYFLFLLLAFL